MHICALRMRVFPERERAGTGDVGQYCPAFFTGAAIAGFLNLFKIWIKNNYIFLFYGLK